MKHIHPFPARMAPEIVLERIQGMTLGQTVLDPMSGSGMVLGQAARAGLQGVGYDLDPLARTLSRAVSTRVNERNATDALSKLIDACLHSTRCREVVELSWIDGDRETREFIRYWFYRKQARQLRALAYHLIVRPVVRSRAVLDIIKVALSRLIISKEPKASLARDTAHSRPHKVITRNEFDIFQELPGSLEHVLDALDASSIVVNARAYRGDARRMGGIADGSIDAVITSPPYLNAIDYMRGHRMSLVWFGHTIEQLRRIRSHAIGAERSSEEKSNASFERLAAEIGADGLDNRKLRILERYFGDLRAQTTEAFRVLKPGATATYVIGNSTIGGCYVRNSELLKRAGEHSGFEVVNEQVRNIPDNLRYLPVSVKATNSLATRMRTEHIIEFSKAA